MPLAEDEIARREYIHSFSEQTRNDQKQWGKQYEQIYVDAKPAFQLLP